MIPCCCESPSFDPYFNLALEEWLLAKASDRVILYLWQNENTVVIGKNQNPWKECKTTLLCKEGGHLARRLSGGGAVYHDLGNLNFTFLMPQDCFDKTRQFSVILDTLRTLGLPASLSGRNDMTLEGKKFSGSAFYKNGRQAYHHGTLLVNADMERLGRYLSPSKAKLQAKGVDSVRSRVVNLGDETPRITIESLKAALKASFSRIYGKTETMALPSETELMPLIQRYRSWEWIYGQKLPFTLELEGRFPWGGIQLCLQVEHGIIQRVTVYTDAMDWELAPMLESILPGCRMEDSEIRRRLSGMEAADQIASLFQ